MLSFPPRSDETSYKYFDFYCFIVLVNRLYLIPLCLYILKKYSKCKQIKYYISCIRHFFIPKILVLLCSYIATVIIIIFANPILSSNFQMNCSTNMYSIKLGFEFSKFFGLYQAYLICFFYWWIWDTFKLKIIKVVKMYYKSIKQII